MLHRVGDVMERRDLVRARQILPDIERRWQDRRHRLALRLEEDWSRVDKNVGRKDVTARRDLPSLYKDIVRTDRVISFLDRALVHLNDIEHGTHHVDGMTMEPASSPARAAHAARALR